MFKVWWEYDNFIAYLLLSLTVKEFQIS